MNRAKIVGRQTAILMVSYGCSKAEMRVKTIDRIEADIQEAYREYAVSHAWTSQIIRRKHYEQGGIWVPGVREAMEELLKQGIRKVAVQPTHLLNGLENRRMTEDIQAFMRDLSQLVIGSQLLASYEDRQKVIQVIGEEIGPKKDEALVLMAHGTRDGKDAALGELDEMFRDLGYENTFLGSMAGQPDFQSVLERIGRRNVKRILLAPFMIAAGKHAERDLGGEQKDSWKCRFEEAGYPAACILKGLGEYAGIRRIFIGHVGDSLRILNKW